MGAAIEISEVEVRFGRMTALDRISLRLETGSMTAVLGPNGAGKSTLLRVMMGLVRPKRGRIVRSDPSQSGLAYLPQLSEIDRSFPIDVIDLVSLGAWSRVGLGGGLVSAEAERVHDAISRVGLRGQERAPIGALSGGQLQRALFARMIVQDAPTVLLDEPFAAVDAATVADLTALLAEWHGEGRTIVAVLHDAALACRHFPDTVLLDTRLVGHGPSATLLAGRPTGLPNSSILPFGRVAA